MYMLFSDIQKIKVTEPPLKHRSGFRLNAPPTPHKLPWQTSDRLRSLTSSYRILPAFLQSLILPFSDGQAFLGLVRGFDKSKFFSNPAIVTSLSGCGVKSTPLLGNFGLVVQRKRRGREGDLCKRTAVETFENLKDTQLELQVYQ